LQEKLGDGQIELNSFIISTTDYNNLVDIQSTLSKEELEAKHIVFQKDDSETYIKKIFYQLGVLNSTTRFGMLF
jgi:hypothetical protein